MSAHPPDGSDQPEAPDQVMLAVLSNAGREAIVLSSDEERLLDDWVAGRLAPDAAERAAGLVKRNALAAERVLERRLLDAARHSPPVPQSLAERVLTPAPPPKASAFGGWWRSLGRRQSLRVVVDTALKDKVETSDGRERLPVRIYDLKDPRAADIRSAITGIPDNARPYLLTLKP